LDGLLDQLGSVVGGVLNSAPVQLIVFGSVAYVTIVWLAMAHWVLRDMRRRRQDPVSPYLAAIGIVLASPILLPITVFTYLVLRPRETLAEARERELTERLDALGAEMALACPGCRRPVEEDWLTCPACRTRLARRCLGCGRTMGLDWSLCGFCGSEFGRPVVAQRVPAAVRGGLLQARVAGRLDGERTSASTRAATAATLARTRRVDRDRPGDTRRELLEPNA
jgi:RNA polymerase subunit RPABC4/transcription elongation factor Spt4